MTSAAASNNCRLYTFITDAAISTAAAAADDDVDDDDFLGAS